MTANMFPVAVLDQRSLNPQELVEEITQLSHSEAKQAYLRDLMPFLDKSDWDQLAAALKEKADHLMRADIQACLQTAELIDYITELTGNPTYHALSALALGNAYVIGLGEFRKGIQYCDEAAAIYEEQERPVDQARTQISKIWALASLGQYDKAFTIGKKARTVLRVHKQWKYLTILISNLAIIHGRLGQDSQALKLFDEALIVNQHFEFDEYAKLMLQMNRSIVLRNLGRFQESIQANQVALDEYRRLGLKISAARAQQNMGMTFFSQGHYNEALILLDKARATFLEDDRHRHAMLVESYVCDCLLQLRRFREVLEKCRDIRKLFYELGTNFEVGQAFLYEASAFTGLGKYEDALQSLNEAGCLFKKEGNDAATADVDLRIAIILLAQNQCEKSLAIAQGCLTTFQKRKLPLAEAQAYLVAARAALACQQSQYAATFTKKALAIGEQHNVPALTHQAHHLEGALQRLHGNQVAALEAYTLAVRELEMLNGRLMLEHRSDFLDGKERIYEDAVSLCLDMNKPAQALAFAERAKSRALQDLLAHRLNLHIEARHESDKPLVENLIQPRTQRDQLYRRWESGERASQADKVNERLDEQQQASQCVLALEKQITSLWHKLLIRNADYARDAALWQVHTEPAQPYLDEDTLLLEFFIANGQLIVFAVTADEIIAQRLPTSLAEIQKLLQLFRLNLNAASRSTPDRLAALTLNAQKVLGQLYRDLLRSLTEQMAPYPKLVIVPHGPLHYLPFHALHDGDQYLLQKHEISYLPGSSLWRYCQETPIGSEGALTVGHNHQNRLANTTQEAQSIADLWSGTALLAEEARLSHFLQAAPQSQIIHLAAHGEFRPDNPLFSGLVLADGWLTTLDIFNLRLNASLVTLSACQTGRSVIGGGDELLGLMRAFLSAGAASLVATLWAVEDSSTAWLMQDFYQHLKAGHTKGSALRQAQLQFIEEGDTAVPHSHPFFWAPFYLVSSPGPL